MRMRKCFTQAALFAAVALLVGSLSCARPAPSPTPAPPAPKPAVTAPQAPSPAPPKVASPAPKPTPPPSPKPTVAAAPAKAWPKQFRLLDSSPGSQSWGMTAYWVTELTDALKMPAGAFPGGNVVNMEPLNNGEGELSFCDAALAFSAFDGKDPFKKPLTNLRLMASVGVFADVFIARMDSPIKSMMELNGKRLALAPKGISATAMAELLMDAAGVTPDTIKKAGGVVSYINWAAQGDGLLNGSIDVGNVISAPVNVHDAFKQVEERFGCRLLEIPDNVIQAVVNKNPYYARGAVNGGVYKGNPKPAYSILMVNNLVTRADLPEDFVYQVLKILFSDKVVKNSREKFTIWPEIGSTEVGTQALNVIPVHPGAAKFWKEDRGVDLAAKGITVK